MHSDDYFIGRDRELAQLDIAIGRGDDGLRLAMLSGPSGLGKTTLARRAADDAAERGFRVASISGRAGSLSVPFAPFMEAMPEFEVLLSVLSSDQSIDIEHAGIGLVNLLAELVVDRPLLLVVDDAQALDESSIALLPYLVGVSERMNLTLLFVEQTDAIGVPGTYRAFIDGVLARRVVNHLQLAPLGDEAVRLLVAHVLDLEDPAQVDPEIVLRAGGNPWFAKELAESWKRGDAEIPTNIAAAATSRLHTLDDIGQDVVNAIALCDEGAHIGWLEALSEQRPRQFVRTMEKIAASGLVREDGDIVTIAHPLMQQALVDELSAAMRRAMHTELAEVIDQVPLPEVVAARGRGFHLAGAGRPAEAVSAYLRAADANEIHGQLHESYADLRHALDAEITIESRIELLKRCATTAMQVDRPSAERFWSEVGRIAAAQGDDETYAYALFQQYWTCNDGVARDRLERAASLGPERLGWSARAAANLASLRGEFGEAIRLDTIALELAQQREDRPLETLTRHRLGVSNALLGQLAESVLHLREAVSLSVQHRLHGWAVSAWHDLCEALVLDLQTTQALQECDGALTYIEDMRLDRLRAQMLSMRASVLARVGDLEIATTVADDAMAAASLHGTEFTPLTHLLRAEVANEAGSVQAGELAEKAMALIRQLGYDSWQHHATFEIARANARTRGLDSTLDQLAGLGTSGEPGLAAQAALWLLRTALLSGSDAAIAVSRDLRATVGDGGGPYVDQAVREFDATIAGLDGGSTAADVSAIAAEWNEFGRALDALRASASAGVLLARSGDREGAKQVLLHAKQGLSKCGAEADADAVASQLRGLGTRSRAKSRETKVGPLTKRELEIARLVASGLKNSEVAGTLFLAEKTVAAHLSNIYGKVEVRSRVQLTQWIRENDPEFDTASLANAG